MLQLTPAHCSASPEVRRGGSESPANMQKSELKQRQKKREDEQKSSSREEEQKRQHSAEKRRSEEERKRESDMRQRFRPDAKLCVSVMCVALSCAITWLFLQQSTALVEMRGKCESVQEKSRGFEELDKKLTEVSQQLQVSADAVRLLSALRFGISSVLNTSAALREEQDASSHRLRALNLRVRSASDWPAASDELSALKTQSRAAHTRVTELVNAIDGRLRQLSERLQEVQDGTRRNTRVLERTEEEDVRRVRELTDGNGRRVSRLQEQLKREAARGRGLRDTLESRAQDAPLEAAEEAVRSMLRVRAHMSATFGRVTELERQCAAVGALLSAPQGSAAPVSSHLSSLAVEVQRVQQGFSILSSEQQRLQRDLSVLHQAVQDVESRALLLSRDVSAKVSSVRTDVRRMGGLQTEVEALLNQTGALEEKVAQAEKLMVKRIGDALAGSIDRVSELKSAAERNGQRLEQVSALAHQISEENRRLSERILALDSGQAKLRKMLRFAEDLKPKVFTVRQDFAMLEPRLSDLTLRIGLLAEDMMREREAEECSAPRNETDPPTA